MLPDADAAPRGVIVGTLQRIANRVRLRTALRLGAIIVATMATVLALLRIVGLSSVWSLIAIGGLAASVWIAALFYLRNSWTVSAAAASVEQAIPDSRNVVVTARELIDHPERARPWVTSRVLDDASRIVRDVEVATIAPLRTPTLLLGSAVTALALVILMVPPRTQKAISEGAASTTEGRLTAIKGLRIAATVLPPAYTNVAARTLIDPDRLDVVEGTVIRIEATGEARPVAIRFGTAALAVANRSDASVAEVTPKANGYLAFESTAPRAAVRLIPVSVSPDRTPTIQIQNPGKDLLMPEGNATVPLTASASDDFGLQSLDLRYTKVSGSGEQFEFVEGTLPLDVAKESDRSWKGKGAIALDRLSLQPGDALVYRVVARDRRPGDGGSASSDSFFIEVAGPGQVAVEGFELPPDRDRYALSQQMIVLKIQRLRARERSMTHDAVQQETASIAAEQRAVRANFVFLMGGQVEDEEHEAEQSHEIQEGRLENSARREINSAIQNMSYAEQALVAVDSAKALPPAKAAVDALQRAFGKNRYFLRTLPVRSRVDPSRRLSGELKDASSWRRDVAPAEVERTTREARRILSKLLTLLRRFDDGQELSSRDVEALAEDALAVAPASSEWQHISAELLNVRQALGSPLTHSTDSSRLWQAATTALVRKAERSALTRDRSTSSALQSAWADEARRR